MSGGGPSSIKRISRCAAGMPAPSRENGNRVGIEFDLEVYDLTFLRKRSDTMHQALYRKWRPKSFDDVYGQEHITSVLRYEIEHGKLSHAYLFCGSRGVGKTTCAKILAKAVNCEHPVNGEPCGVCDACRAVEEGTATDVLEMDAASNNGVDNIRDIRDEVVFAPSQLKYRVYIVDEVHMLSQSAFNALLKTLEEPPSYVIFILATTEQHKLPATIVSRCQRFEFRRIPTPVLSDRLNFIAEKENIDLTPDASHLLARLAQGGMRDAISLLELCAGSGERITPSLVCDTVGSTGREQTLKIAKAVSTKDYDTIFSEIDSLVSSSKSIAVFCQDMISFWRDMLVFRSSENASEYLDLTDAETEELAAIAGKFTKETLLWHCGLLDDALARINRSASTARITAELTLIRMCDEKLDNRTDALLSRISKLEAVRFSNPTVQPEKSYETPVSDNENEDEKPYVTVTTDKTVKSNIVNNEKASSAATTYGKRVLRPLRAWADILDEIRSSDIVKWINLNAASAYTDESGNAIIRFDSDFQRRRAEETVSIGELSQIVSSHNGQAINVVFETAPSSGGASDGIIDEILDNLEENLK